MNALHVGVLTVKTASHARNRSGLYASDPSRRHMFDECMTNTKKGKQ